tara:strand:+ start:2683 stop:4431 length:1749 start_codon:yes stop_codon:yes gene_type:complete
MATHIQLHRTCITGGVPDPSIMLEGEPAVNLRDRKLWVKGCENSLVTLIGGASGERVAGTVNEVQYEGDGGFSADVNFTYNSTTGVLRVRGGGVSADGITAGLKGITCYGNIEMLSGNSIGIDGEEKITFHSDYIKLAADDVITRQKISHNGDSDTYLEFQTNEIRAFAGGSRILDGNANGILHAPVGISSDGATFGVKGITLEGDIYLSEDSAVRIGGDTEHILFNGGSARIDLVAGQVMVGSGGGNGYLTSYGDNDTWMRYQANQWSQRSGGTDYIRTNPVEGAHFPAGISAAGGTFSSGASSGIYTHIHDGGITVMNGAIFVKCHGDANLKLQADSDNVDETHNPLIQLGQDGSDGQGKIGLNSNNNVAFQDARSNALYVYRTSGDVQLAAGGNTGGRLTVHDGDSLPSPSHNGGGVGIGSGMYAPRFPLEVEGVAAASGVSADGFTAGHKGITVGGNLYMSDNTVSRPKLKDFSETVAAITWTNPCDIDFEDGNVQTLTVAIAGQTVQFSNPPASGTAGTVTVIITNGGSQTVTWPAAVKWPSNVAPSLSSSGVDIITFMTIDAGTTIYGFVGGLNFS